MKKIIVFAVFLQAASVIAGDIRGKVSVPGGNDHSDVVVYVDRIAGKTFPPAAEHAKLNQKARRFMPRVKVVLVGTTVDFLNSDTGKHNAHTIDACAGNFDLGLWAPGETKSYTFSRECAATILCNVHPDMEAFVVAVPTPYFAVVGEDGSYAIAGVPDGTYNIKLWHPSLKTTEHSVTVNGPTEANFEMKK